MSIPVVCIGNIEIGGVGKTPLVAALAERFALKGKKVAIVSRGYRRLNKKNWFNRIINDEVILVDSNTHTASDVGDEPLMLDMMLNKKSHEKKICVYVAADKKQAGQKAVADGADIIILDDGHQNFTLYKDITLIVTSLSHETHNPNNFATLPAGKLRENWYEGLKRADAVVIVGYNPTILRQHDPKKYLSIKNNKINSQKDNFKVEGRLLNIENYLNRQIYAFAGIGNPEKFFLSLRNAGIKLVGTKSFPDHHYYTQKEILTLKLEAISLGAEAIITTEKDWVKVSPLCMENSAEIYFKKRNNINIKAVKNKINEIKIDFIAIEYDQINIENIYFAFLRKINDLYHNF